MSARGSFVSRSGIREISRALAQPVTYLGIIMLVFIYCALTYLIIADRKMAEYDAGMRGDNLARVVEQSFSNIFKSVDASLLFLRKSYQQNPSTFNLEAWARDPLIRNELTFEFGMTDADGRVIASSVSKTTIGNDRSGHEVFLAQANSAEDKLIISRPLLSRSSGKREIFISRRIIAPDGTFGGVVVAYLDPGELVKNIGAPELGSDGSIALVGFDMGHYKINGASDSRRLDQRATGLSFIPTGAPSFQ